MTENQKVWNWGYSTNLSPSLFPLHPPALPTLLAPGPLRPQAPPPPPDWAESPVSTGLSASSWRFLQKGIWLAQFICWSQGHLSPGIANSLESLGSSVYPWSSKPGHPSQDEGGTVFPVFPAWEIMKPISCRYVEVYLCPSPHHGQGHPWIWCSCHWPVRSDLEL